jgi:hypothetical protein
MVEEEEEEEAIYSSEILVSTYQVTGPRNPEDEYNQAFLQGHHRIKYL